MNQEEVHTAGEPLVLAISEAVSLPEHQQEELREALTDIPDEGLQVGALLIIPHQVEHINYSNSQ